MWGVGEGSRWYEDEGSHEQYVLPLVTDVLLVITLFFAFVTVTASCQVKESGVNGHWKVAVVYQHKEDNTIVFWFGGEEYEGLKKGVCPALDWCLTQY